MRPTGTRAAGAARAVAGAYGAVPFAARLRLHQRAWAGALRRTDTQLSWLRAALLSAEPSHIARAITDRLAATIQASSWAVIAADLDERLVVLADSGLTPSLVPVARDVATWVRRHDRTFLSGDLRGDGRVTAVRKVTALALPLRGREQVLGAVVALDRSVSAAAPAPGRGLSDALGDILTHAALALDTALRVKRAEALSVTDDLTRLYNARYLNLALRREVRLANRNSRPLSLLFIDLDGFKSINDSHGHLAGSRALVEAGGVIRGSARETDIVARFGGDEFALILPDTGLAGALHVAERIRERLAGHGFLASDGFDIHLTASVGVATLPEVATAADELVQAADAAMYRVKDRGKNGIQAAAAGR